MSNSEMAFHLMDKHDMDNQQALEFMTTCTPEEYSIIYNEFHKIDTEEEYY